MESFFNFIELCKYALPRACTSLAEVKSVVKNTVELGFKNRQNKNLLDFKNQITNYQFMIYVVNYSQDKNILDFKDQNGSDRKSS